MSVQKMSITFEQVEWGRSQIGIDASGKVNGSILPNPFGSMGNVFVQTNSVNWSAAVTAAGEITLYGPVDETYQGLVAAFKLELPV